MFLRRISVRLGTFLLGDRYILCRRFSMQRCVVRCVPEEEKMAISYKLGEGQRNLLRAKTETLGGALSRIVFNATKHLNKGKKKKKAKLEGATPESESNTITAQLTFNKVKVEDDIPNSEAWQEGAILEIGEHRYVVNVNPPMVKSVVLPISIMAGFPLFPRLDLDFASRQDSCYTWYREDNSGPSTSSTANSGDSKRKSNEQDNQTNWVQASRDLIYTPVNSDIGSKLKFVCTPRCDGKEGVTMETVTSCQVEAGPGLCPFENRHLYTKKRTEKGCFRVVSYNILADVYAKTELSLTVLYPYCPPYALELDYRRQLLLKELVGYNADLLVLQETGKSLYNDALVPALDLSGMEGVFMGKGQQSEGEAIFYRKDKFRLLSQEDMIIGECLSSHPSCHGLQTWLSHSPAVLNKVTSGSTVLQVVLLESIEDPSRRLCVANTHLYWHPRAPHIRLIQMATCLKFLENVVNSNSTQDTSISLLLCGDLNSPPTSGLYELLTTRAVPASHTDWFPVEPQTTDDGKLELQEGVDLSHPFNLTSACGLPDYTNYVGGFQGTLDYIMIDTCQLAVNQTIPMPTHEEVTTNTALPSIVFPSDHIAIIADVEWKKS
ncbi:PDE12 [Branchiostoma lanceolatum]|uniref:2',5'-phosphodiesterase 12 n=1 Tax=Branchiostoma lanceolatum TaxID=7740 RepID=A0A8J9Z9S2_BRALA|nr:PDE12 [Branchiostoma lanceolatum]